MGQTLHDMMSRATALTRKGSVAEATRLIQQKLGISSSSEDVEASASERSKPAGTSQSKRIEAKVRKAASGAADARAPKPSTWRRSQPKLRMKPLGTRHPPVAPGAQYSWHTHASPYGPRRYRLYVPAALIGKTAGAPLVVMLHGCTQDPDDFALGTRMNVLAERDGFVVAYPEQTRAANAMACWNWFQPEHQTRGGAEPASIAGIAQEIVAAHKLDPSRVYAAGLSAGGAMVAVLGQVHSDVFAAVGVHSGLPVGCARDVASAQAAMARGGAGSRGGRSGRTIVVHGGADRTVNAANGVAIFQGAARGLRQDVSQVGAAQVSRAVRPDGIVEGELWEVPGLAHAWSGGDAGGSYTSAGGPDASEAMLRFFLG